MPRTDSSPSLHYDVHWEGPRAEAPPVLLVMGLGMRGRVWEPQVGDLARDHRVATFDNHGIGQSDPMRGLPRMHDFARDALRVADQVGFGSFHLVGVSMGGMISQELALVAPERVRSLTLIATHAGGPLGIVPVPTGIVGFLRSVIGPKSGRVRALQELLYTPEFLASADKRELDTRTRLQFGEPAAPRTMFAQLLAVARHDTRDRLGVIAAPTLVIRPDRDLLVRPSHSTHLARGIRGARLLAIPDAGHGLAFQRAEQISAAIRAHVAEAEGAANAPRHESSDDHERNARP